MIESHFKSLFFVKKTVLLLLFLGLGSVLFSQNLKGRVLDETGEPLPFASVYFQGSTVGTSTNISGYFELENQAEYKKLVFSSVGYSKKVLDKALFLKANAQVSLESQSVTLQAFEVKKRKRDRAYYIMKNAIKRRDYFNNLVEKYRADVYMKGAVYLTEIPEYLIKLAGADSSDLPDSSDLGLMFLTESVNRIQYQAPNQLKEEMVASKVSGGSAGLNDFSWNRSRQVMVNLYENLIDLNVGGRGFVSPLSSSAFIYYNFTYQGYFNEGDYLINKIKIDPKREGDPAFNGYIYIVEDEWNIHSADLQIDKRSNVEYVDSIDFKQNFSVVNDSIFMPMAVNLDIYYTILGVKASYRALGQLSNYDLSQGIEPNTKKNLIFEVKNEALEVDSSYWENERPVLLAEEEVLNYYKTDSIQKRRTDPEYLDSLDRARNKLSATNLFFLGSSFSKRKDSSEISIPALLTTLQYTSVDGAVVQLEPTYTKNKKHSFIEITPRLRYGFASKNIDASVLFRNRRNEENYLTYQAELGTNTVQINPDEPISRDLNSYYNLFRDINYGQFYRERFIARASVAQNIANGLNAQLSMSFTARQNLNNTISKATNPEENVRFTPNIAAVSNRPDMFFTALRMQYQPKNLYEIYPNRVRNLGSKWPVFEGIVKISPNYFTQLSLSVRKRFDLGLLGSTRIFARTGRFIDNKIGSENINFVDREHFVGNQTTFSQNDFTAFNLAPYYDFSAADVYNHVAVEHNFNGWIFNKLPLLRKTQLRTVLSLKYLKSDNRNDYYEAGIGIANIFKVLRLDVVSSLQAGTFSAPALLIGVSFLN